MSAHLWLKISVFLQYIFFVSILLEMAERKGSLLAKSVSKHAVRAKEKLLQNLGKVDRTEDEIFDENLDNFNKQQAAASRLQKEFTNYIRCIRAVQGASKTLYECISDVYESGWTGQDMVYLQTQSLEMLWQDLSHKLTDQVLLPLNTYCAQFPEMRKKIDKRSRKLVDYDSNRHSLQSLEGGGKKRDESKISKAKEQLLQAKKTYDTMNSELHEELPALYQSRIAFLVNNLQTLFSAEQLFHSETSKVYSEMEAIVDRLATDCQKQSVNFKVDSPKVKTDCVESQNSPTLEKEGTTFKSVSPPSSPEVGQTGSGSKDDDESSEKLTFTQLNNELNNGICKDTSEQSKPNASVTPSLTSQVSEEKPNPSNHTEKSPSISSEKEIKPSQNTENLCNIPAGATVENLPPGVLYRVKATYRYNREDVDELSFDVNEIIQVVEYDDPDEQEEGWLMGIKESTNEKGMFPFNFTRPL